MKQSNLPWLRLTGKGDLTGCLCPAVPSQEASRSWITSSRWVALLDMDKPDLALEVLLTGPTRKRSMDQQIALPLLLGLSYYRLDDRKRLLRVQRSTSTIRTFRIRLLLAELEGQ